MKKYYIALFAALVALSCSKENEVTDNTPATPKKVTVQASIDNKDVDANTKTDYVINEMTHKAIFCWKGTEQIGRISFDGGTTSQTVYTSTSSADANETSLIFSGDEVSNDTGFAVYPKKGATNGAGFDWYSATNTVYLWLGESLTYVPTAQLSNIVPMIGKLDEGEFVFKPVTGVLAVRIEHMPPSANKVMISSNNHYLSKLGFRNSSSDSSYEEEFDAIYSGGMQLAQNNNAASKAKTKTYTFDSGLDFGTTYTFYFPIPAGTLNNGSDDELTVSILNGSTTLYTKTTSKSINITNGTITRLPLISLPSYTVTVAPGGTSNDLKAQVTTWSAGVAKVKVYAAASSATAQSNVGTSGAEITALNTLTAVPGSYSTSGLYYIAYQGYDSSDNALEGTSGTVTAYYLSDSDKSKLVYPSGLTISGTARSSWYDNKAIFAESNDVTKGHVMLTYFDGMASTQAASGLCNDHPFFTIMSPWLGGTSSHNASYQFNSARITDGDGFYGVIEDGTLTFNPNATSAGDATDPAFFYYSVDGSGSARVFLISSPAEGDGSSSSLQPLVFTMTDTKLTVSYLKVRWYGTYCSSTSAVAGSKSQAARRYASNVEITLHTE